MKIVKDLKCPICYNTKLWSDARHVYCVLCGKTTKRLGQRIGRYHG